MQEKRQPGFHKSKSTDTERSDREERGGGGGGRNLQSGLLIGSQRAAGRPAALRGSFLVSPLHERPCSVLFERSDVTMKDRWDECS